MKRKMHSPLFAIPFAAASVLCFPSLLCTHASGQSAVAFHSFLRSGVENGPEAADPAKPKEDIGGTEILSDTRGVNFQPYLTEILRGIYGRWTGLLPDEARKPTLAKGETDIRFTINPKGEIAAMHLDASTHDNQLNNAAWGAISGARQFPPLPTDFTGPNLEIRVHFKVNTEAPAGSGSSPSR